jgi:2-oxoglutarate dehydrogenase E1 component
VQCLADAGFTGMRPQYAGRESSASPATGLAKRHAAEQAALIAAALGHPPTNPASTKPGANSSERAGGPAVAAH